MTDRDRLTTFFYLLTRGTPGMPGLGWGSVHELIDTCKSDSPVTFTSEAGEALARAMVDRLFKPEAVNIDDKRRRQTLRDAARMLAGLRGYFCHPQTIADVNAMIDECNLASMNGVEHSEPDEPTRHPGVHDFLAVHDRLQRQERPALTLETATGVDLDFAGTILRAPRGKHEIDATYRERLLWVARNEAAVLGTGASAAEVERLRRFESGVTDLFGEPIVGTDKMLERLRERLAADRFPLPPQTNGVSFEIAQVGDGWRAAWSNADATIIGQSDEFDTYNGACHYAWSEALRQASSSRRIVEQHYHFSTGGGCPITVQATAARVHVNGDEVFTGPACLRVPDDAMESGEADASGRDWTLIDSEETARRFIGKRVEVRAPAGISAHGQFTAHELDGKVGLVTCVDRWVRFGHDGGVDWKARGNVSLRLAGEP